ncbi:hypothetical protein NONO_c16060 [Nocardia nova SH22a]|uniref:Uncharacterized protein n=1 Tax=Nocardia nova SH22a TaxID=1415166 RepID=W5TB44_9NOCA|nr:hypothetical protein [Nocardia nova]AHH16407.1 hypothetical protein NONO_c16060 [Nocardia nova SH22a]
MYPERESPYWKAIVGENWPQIPPRAWRDLETSARDGADALDPAEADRARRSFDELVTSSAGLQPVKDDLLAHQGTTRGFVDALVAAADTFGHMANLVDRTRDRILNIVDDALRRIQRATAEAEADAQAEADSEDPDDDGAAEARKRRRIAEILARARAEVAEVAQEALDEVGPRGLPELAAIAAALGQPNPWRTRPTGRGGAGGTGAGRGRPGVGDRIAGQLPPGLRTLPRGMRLPDGTFVPDIPALRDLRDLLRQLVPGSPLSRLPGSDLLGPDGTDGLEHGDAGRPEDGPVTVSPTRGQPPPATEQAAGPEPGGAPETGPAAGYFDGGGHAASAPGPEAAVGATDSHAPAEQVDPGVSQTRSDPGTVAAASDEGFVDSDDETSTTAGYFGSERQRDEVSAPDRGADSGFPGDLLTGTSGFTAFGAAAASAPVFAPQQGPPAAAPPPGASAPPGAGAPPGSAQLPDPRAAESRGPAVPPRISSPAGGPAVGGSGVTAPGASAAAPGIPGKGQPPARPAGEPVAATGADTGDDKPAAGSGDLMRDAVGAAMLASAAPTFMLGKRVDGDLVLARSILASLLAASEAATLGAAWALSVMRYDGGLTAFVTSNDGRGWLPPAVFLPRELSTPWVWSVAEGPGWEGFADPARILAEFAVAWGRRTGARLSAMVSSGPFDENLARQLGDVALEGGVEPCPFMDFTTAAPGLADRLELVSAPPVLERVAAVPADRLGSRGLDFAYDAHGRLAGAGPNPFASLGTSELRNRILQTILRGGPVQAQWWEDLRDADTLLAASILPLQLDVSRVPLGELRSEAAAGRSAADASTLRRLVAERRCDELVLLMSGEPSRQRLRDIVYAHGQVSEFLGSVPTAPTAPPTPRRPTITAGPNG